MQAPEMQNNLNNPNNLHADPNNPPVAENSTQDLTMQQMMEVISQQLGGTPSEREGASFSPTEQSIVDKQFEQDVRWALEDMQKQVKGKIPDASDTQAFQIGIGMMEGDITKVIDAVADALKREAEMDEKNENLKPLHVEGGESGKADDSRLTGLAGVLQSINQKYQR